MNTCQKPLQYQYYMHLNDLHALDNQLARPQSGSVLKDAVFRLMKCSWKYQPFILDFWLRRGVNEICDILEFVTLCKMVVSYWLWRSNVRASQIYSNICPKRCNSAQFIYIWRLLYMFRVLLPPIIRSAYNCIYNIWYLSHRYCCLPLSRQVAVTQWQIPDV
jgi:hypothetical protein